MTCVMNWPSSTTLSSSFRWTSRSWPSLRRFLASHSSFIWPIVHFLVIFSTLFNEICQTFFNTFHICIFRSLEQTLLERLLRFVSRSCCIKASGIRVPFILGLERLLARRVESRKVSLVQNVEFIWMRTLILHLDSSSLLWQLLQLIFQLIWVNSVRIEWISRHNTIFLQRDLAFLLLGKITL